MGFFLLNLEPPKMTLAALRAWQLSVQACCSLLASRKIFPGFESKDVFMHIADLRHFFSVFKSEVVHMLHPFFPACETVQGPAFR